jgi:hypothetical protein
MQVRLCCHFFPKLIDYKMSKNISDFNEKLAKVMMANSADASEEEALWALQESGESVSRKWEYELYVRAILHAFFCVLYFYP